MIKNSQQLKKQRWVNENAFKRRLKYNLKKAKLFKLRKWLYSSVPVSQLTISQYMVAGSLVYSPSYLSFESVLHQAGVIFQYYDSLSFAGPYTRELQIWDQDLVFWRLPPSLLTYPIGIVTKDHITQATPERAICDILYHNKHYPLDHLPRTLDRKLLMRIATIYSTIKWQKKLPKIVASLLKKWPKIE